MAKKILVVIDVQNDFVGGALRNEEAIKKIPNIVKKIREFNGDAIYATRDTHYEGYLQSKEGQKLPVTHCVIGTEGWEIEANVKAALDDAKLRNISVTYIDKPTFGSLELMDTIGKVTGDLEVEVCGYCTDICVVSNALLLKAMLYANAELTVDATCCAGVTVDSHKAALTTMKMCQINVINEDKDA